MREVKQVTVAEFRETFRTLKEPVEVIRYREIVGRWIPGGQMPDAPPVGWAAEREALEEEVRQLKRRLAERSVEAPARREPKFSLDRDVLDEWEADSQRGVDAFFGTPRPAPKPVKRRK